MVNISISSFVIAIPEIYLIIMSFIILLYGSFSNLKDNNEKILFFNKISYVSVLILIFALMLIYSIGSVSVSTFNGLFVLSPSIYIFKTIILILMIFISVLSRKYLIDIGLYSYEYVVLVLFLICGNLLLVSSNDLMSFYVCLEMSTLCSYLLIFLNKNNNNANDAGLKYFILGALGTGFLLYGISLIYGFSGATNFIDIKKYLDINNTQNWILILGLVMILVGIGFKLSLAPFHMWTIDVYKGSHSSVIMILTTIVKFSVAFVLLRLLFEVFLPLYIYWKSIVEILIICTAIIGFIGAIYQKNIKSFLAYSSIANMSYLLMSLLSVKPNSFVYMFTYMLIYGVAVIGFIGVIVLFKKNNNQIMYIEDLAGVAKKNPYFAFVLTTFVLSMAGLPITAGFFGKILILYSVIKSNLYGLAIFVSFLTVVITYFYLKIIKTMYFDNDESNTLYMYVKKDNAIINISIFILFVFTLGFIFVVPFIFNFLDRIVSF